MTISFKKSLLASAAVVAAIAAVPAISSADTTITSSTTQIGSSTNNDGITFGANSITLTVSGGVNLTDADAIVETGAFTGATVINHGTITGGGQIGIDVNATGFSLNNLGTITAGAADAVDIAAASTGYFINSGTITTTSALGVDLDAALTHANGIVNSGTISASTSGSALDLGATFTKLTNSGVISSATGSGVLLTGGAAITGAITNTGTIYNTAGTADAIDIAAGTTTTGSITNSGLISSFAGIGIDVNAGLTSIVNQSGGTIVSTSGNNAAIDVATGLTVSISNAGTVEANGTGDTLLTVALVGDVTNTGTIINNSTGGAVDISGALTGSFANTGGLIKIVGSGANAALDFGSTVSGSITNTGTITTPGSAEGIVVTGALAGSFANTGGTISSGTGKGIDFVTTIGGAFTNTGTIKTTAGSEDGIEFGGNITSASSNAGTISSAGGIAIDLDADFTAGFTNTGTITAVGLTIDADGDFTTLTNSGSSAVISSTGAATKAIDFFATEVVTLTNTGGAKITAAGTADTINFAGAAPTGVINNEAGSTISNTGAGSAINYTTGVITGGITNAGTISVTAGKTAIQLDATSSHLTTGVVNTGTIDAGVTGVAIDYSASTDNLAHIVTNTNGTIIGSIKLAGDGGETNAVTLTGGSLTVANAAADAILGTAANDTITISGGFEMVGVINGVGGTDVINIGKSATASTDSFSTGGLIDDIDTINVDYGTFNIGHDLGTGTTITNLALDAGTTTNVTESVTIDSGTVTSLGTLTVAAGKTAAIADGASADLTLGANSVVTIKVTDLSAVGTSTGKITVTDTATVAGTLKLDFSGADKYIATGNLTGIITANSGLNTAFTTYSSSSPVFTVTNNASAAGSANVTVTRNTYQSLSTTVNDDAVGAALETIGAAQTGDAALRSILGDLDGSTTVAALTSNLESLSPSDINGAVTQTAIAVQNASVGVVENQLASYRDGEASGIAAGGAFSSNGIWGQAFGTTASQDTRDNVKGYDADTIGFAVGADTSVTDKDRVGIAASYATTEVDHERSGNSSTDIDSLQVSLYGSHDEDKWYVEGLLGMAFNQYDNTRTLTVGADRVASADFDGTQFTAKTTGGYKHSLGNGMNLTPTLSLQYSRTSVDSYTETGSSANLTVDADDTDVLEGGLGARVSYPITQGSVTFVPEVSAEYRYDFIGDEYEASSNFTSVSGTTFVSKGADVAQSTLALGAGLDVIAQDNVTVSFDYEADIKEDYISHNGSLKARFAF